VAILEKLALLKIALCKATVLNRLESDFLRSVTLGELIAAIGTARKGAVFFFVMTCHFYFSNYARNLPNTK
jgi:hypothetical protein